MHLLALVTLLAAECPPSPPAGWGAVARLRPANLDAVVTGDGARAAAERLKARVATAGGALSRVEATPAGLRLTGYVEGDLPHLRKLLRPGTVTIHVVDEPGIAAAASDFFAGPYGAALADHRPHTLPYSFSPYGGPALPARVPPEALRNVEVRCNDCAALRADHPVPGETWLASAGGRAFLVGPPVLDDAQIDRCAVSVDDASGRPRVRLRLRAAGRARLAALPRTRRFVLTVDGEAWAAQATPDGALLVDAEGDPQATRDLAALLRHGPLPDGLRLEPAPR